MRARHSSGNKTKSVPQLVSRPSSKSAPEGLLLLNEAAAVEAQTLEAGHHVVR